MDALKMQRNEEKVLSDSPLRNTIKVAYDKNKLIGAANVAAFLLKKLIGMPSVNHFFDYHKVHAAYFAGILISVEKMEPIDEEIEQMRANIDKYVRETEMLLDAIRQIPSDPLEGYRNPLVIMEIAKDPGAADAYDRKLNDYQQTTQISLNAATEYAHQGRAIERDTGAQAQIILDKLNAMPVNTPADQVLINSSKKRVQFIQLDLMTRVQNTRSKAEDAVKRVEPLLIEVNQIDRINARR